MRLQFRGLPEDERKAFLFDQVVDTVGRRFAMPVAAACMAASRRMYALGLGCEPAGIAARWAQALANPMPPSTILSCRPAGVSSVTSAPIALRFERVPTSLKAIQWLPGTREFL